MSKEEYRVQCRLRKRKSDGWFMYQTTWIPEKYAQVGRVLKLKNEKGKWDDGWEIIDTWSRKRADEINERSRDHLYQRKSSDI